MIVGIVGSESEKFTARTEALARAEIRRLVLDADLVVSGACHLGGIDVWAIAEAKWAGVDYREYPPATLAWTTGYKPRNLAIARASDLVVCITVRVLPPGFKGMRFEQGCYHCARHGIDPHSHVKSGGCWTRWEAEKLGKQGRLIVI